MARESEGSAIRVILIEDHLLVRQGLRALLEQDCRARVVGEAGTAAEALRLLAATECDFVLMDVNLPDGDGLSCLESAVSQRPELRIVMLTMQTDPETVERALRSGARGFLPKAAGIDEIFEAFRAIHNGGTYLHPLMVASLVRTPASRSSQSSPTDHLTQRERDVLSRVVRGMTNAQIGRELFLAESTVKTHLRNLYSKLQVANRSELVYRVMSEGLLQA